MTTPTEASRRAWQPLTPRGVAAFARAPLRRLWLVQFIFAALAAAMVVWCVRTAWFPTVRAAISHLPEQGEIQSGKLNWTGDSPYLLADGHFLAFTVDLDHSGTLRSPAHVQVEFGRNDFYVFSLTGYAEVAYPKDWIIAFNRAELQPWWGAWEPPILWITVAVVMVSLMVGWTLLATVFFLPAWLVGFFANRELNLQGSWKLAGAALMPGALFLTVAMLFYGLGILDLVQLVAAAAAHLFVGWTYLFVSPSFAPQIAPVTSIKTNPFAVPPGKPGEAADAKTKIDPPASRSGMAEL